MTPPARVPSATSCSRVAGEATVRTETLVGSWAACAAARTTEGVAPLTPMGRTPSAGWLAKAKPRTAAMASGATRLVMSTERSRSRRRSSLRATIPVSRRAPRRSRHQKLPLAGVIALEPVGVVVGGRTAAIDDDWGAVGALIRLDPGRFGPDAVAGLEDFSHLIVVFQFHLVAESEVQSGARRPRGNPDWPEVG